MIDFDELLAELRCYQSDVSAYQDIRWLEIPVPLRWLEALVDEVQRHREMLEPVK